MVALRNRHRGKPVVKRTVSGPKTYTDMYYLYLGALKDTLLYYAVVQPASKVFVRPGKEMLSSHNLLMLALRLVDIFITKE